MNAPDTFDDFIGELTEHARNVEDRDPATSIYLHQAAGLLCHQSAALLRAEAARVVLDWLTRERRDTFTAQTCYQRFKSRWSRMADLSPALDLLEERGFIRRQQQQGPAKPGRPSLGFEVHPTIRGGYAMAANPLPNNPNNPKIPMKPDRMPGFEDIGGIEIAPGPSTTIAKPGGHNLCCCHSAPGSKRSNYIAELPTPGAFPFRRD